MKHSAFYKLIFPLNKKELCIVDTLTLRFLKNDRIQSIIRKSKRNDYYAVFTLIAHCYLISKKSNGVVHDEDFKTVLLYYNKSNYKFSIREIIRLIYLIINFFDVKSLLWIQSREHLVNKIRDNNVLAQKFDDYIYVWFLAQHYDVKNLTQLVSLKNKLFDLAKNQNLPIYIETTIPRLIKHYKRIGFQFYEKSYDSISQSTIYFGRYIPF